MSLQSLPFQDNFETATILKATIPAHRYLAELKGAAKAMPNEDILINALAIQEAKDSSEIEQIITTHDAVFRATVQTTGAEDQAAKEVRDYKDAVYYGFRQIQQVGLILDRDIRKMNELLTHNSAGYRKVPGTALRNSQTGDVVYMPPQHPQEIIDGMSNLLQFINDTSLSDIDPLIKMAIIHHRFESIHPFYDGNGRTGRILNILYLINNGLLDSPILYLSRYIVQTKTEYYRLLQQVRDTGEWEEWIVYILRGIEQTAKQTLHTVEQIKGLMMDFKHRLRSRLPKLYSQDLLNNLFFHPYTKIDYIIEALHVSRPTASKYLQLLVKHGFLKEEQMGVSKFFVNHQLMALLKNVERG
jgi:Fic family protein